MGRIRASVTKIFIACGHGRASGNSGNTSDHSLLPPPFMLLKVWVQPEPTGDRGWDEYNTCLLTIRATSRTPVVLTNQISQSGSKLTWGLSLKLYLPKVQHYEPADLSFKRWILKVNLHNTRSGLLLHLSSYLDLTPHRPCPPLSLTVSLTPSFALISPLMGWAVELW